MTLLDRLKLALRSPLLPLAMLLLALSTVFIFGGERGHFYPSTGLHDWLSAQHLTIAMNISYGFQRFERRIMGDGGITSPHRPYNRFSIRRPLHN